MMAVCSVVCEMQQRGSERGSERQGREDRQRTCMHLCLCVAVSDSSKQNPKTKTTQNAPLDSHLKESSSESKQRKGNKQGKRTHTWFAPPLRLLAFCTLGWDGPFGTRTTTLFGDWLLCCCWSISLECFGVVGQVTLFGFSGSSWLLFLSPPIHLGGCCTSITGCIISLFPSFFGIHARGGVVCLANSKKGASALLVLGAPSNPFFPHLP